MGDIEMATSPASQPAKRRPRWLLVLQAQVWRFLMQIGMFLHKVAPPRPPKPNFSRVIPTAISPHKGTVRIHFYLPKDYGTRKALRGKKFPLVVNFHGGGFTLGTATDDARWAGAVVKQVGAVVASVDYRLAPEYHFPTAVEDGVDSLMYLTKHAEDLWIDVDKIALSGFSSGGNMAFTVPLRLQEELVPDLDERGGNTADLNATQLSPNKTGTVLDGTTIVRVSRPIHIAAIVSWYPSTDYTNTRAQRRETSIRNDQDISAIFTELFDESYLQPPTMDLSNPYLSPGLASYSLLKSLPNNILLFVCEWDMLREEATRLKSRLDEMGKSVKWFLMPGVHHGFDKSPNPFTPSAAAKQQYATACKELRRIFNTPP